MKERERIDRLMVERGLSSSRERARAIILSGAVLSGGRKIEKVGARVPRDIPIRVLRPDHPFVSRGGVKLAHALASFGISVEGSTVMDVGSGTGGFTDCLLQKGASRVYAVDVGYGQLAWSLRCDPRVVLLERTNIRTLSPDRVPESVDLVTIDVSFISLKIVLPTVRSFVKPGGRVIALIKPQFEVGRKEVGRGGIVRDPEQHERVVRDVVQCAERAGFCVEGCVRSPLPGQKGNQEFFISVRKDR